MAYTRENTFEQVCFSLKLFLLFLIINCSWRANESDENQNDRPSTSGGPSYTDRRTDNRRTGGGFVDDRRGQNRDYGGSNRE